MFMALRGPQGTLSSKVKRRLLYVDFHNKFEISFDLCPGSNGKNPGPHASVPSPY